MKPADIHLDHDLAGVLRVVEQRTIAFLRDELKFIPDKIERCLRRDLSISLHATTAMVGVGSLDGLYIAFSYDDLLIRAVTRRFAAELTISDDEQVMYQQETASEIVNIIVGNCTAALAGRGQAISLSPPILIGGARTIMGRPKTAIASATLHFSEGSLELIFVGPRALFDDQLNYKGEL